MICETALALAAVIIPDCVEPTLFQKRGVAEAPPAMAAVAALVVELN